MDKLFIKDEHGVSWLVKPGDPGMAAVKLLREYGFAHQVIPRSVLSSDQRFDIIESWQEAQARADPTVRTRLNSIIKALEEYLWLND